MLLRTGTIPSPKRVPAIFPCSPLVALSSDIFFTCMHESFSIWWFKGIICMSVKYVLSLSLSLPLSSFLQYSSFQRAFLYSSLKTLFALVSLGSQFCLLGSKRLQVPFPDLQSGNSLQIVRWGNHIVPDSQGSLSFIKWNPVSYNPLFYPLFYICI